VNIREFEYSRKGTLAVRYEIKKRGFLAVMGGSGQTSIEEA
jgi:hypothetical protein